ncbi:FxsA family protein [Blastococcus saxobsidens]|uniref:Protein affecting phage T7 exclusion by the F plasmid n=1 Tax=Blastococcus saxobsidens (strain DD2) TaxID=1146883 RepID=H6RIY2_BLASD|nr:FxsA family protein [Blastococcus saxobsidens]CCG03524.1 Protein affecting phage T7 exclusion by the F plasmid [Blastococcus saxobsidens DD2]
MADLLRRRLRLVVGSTALAELVVFVLVAAWIGVGWTVLAMLATSALGWILLARQGRRALTDLRARAASRQAPGKELGDAGLAAVGGLLMVLPGFIGDLLGLLCLLPGTRGLLRRVLSRVVLARLPDHVRGPVRVGSTRSGHVPPAGPFGSAGTGEHLVVEGEIVDGPTRDRPRD